DSIETNIKATELIRELTRPQAPAAATGSTSEVYGKLDKPKFSEGDDVILAPTSNARRCLRRLEDDRRIPRARLLQGEGAPDGILLHLVDEGVENLTTPSFLDAQLIGKFQLGNSVQALDNVTDRFCCSEDSISALM